MHESICMHIGIYVCVHMHVCIYMHHAYSYTICMHYCCNLIKGLFVDLNKLITKIDKRLEKKSKMPSNKKKRVHGSIRYHSSPPAGIPKWMLRPSTGIHGELSSIDQIYTFGYIYNFVNVGNTDSLENGMIDSIETVDVPGMYLSV